MSSKIHPTTVATAAEIRSRPARDLRAHSTDLAPVSGEIEIDTRRSAHPIPRCADRPLPLERTPNYYTGEHRSGGGS